MLKMMSSTAELERYKQGRGLGGAWRAGAGGCSSLRKIHIYSQLTDLQAMFKAKGIDISTYDKSLGVLRSARLSVGRGT